MLSYFFLAKNTVFKNTLKAHLCLTALSGASEQVNNKCCTLRWILENRKTVPVLGAKDGACACCL